MLWWTGARKAVVNVCSYFTMSALITDTQTEFMMERTEHSSSNERVCAPFTTVTVSVLCWTVSVSRFKSLEMKPVVPSLGFLASCSSCCGDCINTVSSGSVSLLSEKQQHVLYISTTAQHPRARKCRVSETETSETGCLRWGEDNTANTLQAVCKAAELSVISWMLCFLLCTV